MNQSAINDGVCIVDSGTNMISLNPPVLAAIRKSFAALDLPGQHELFQGEAVKMSATDIAAYPKVSIKLGFPELSVSGRDYLVESPTNPGSYLMGLVEGECIIGDLVMIKYFTVYDPENTRIGFAPLREGSCV